MATKLNGTASKKPFSYRCFVNKEFQKFDSSETLTRQCHLELDESCSAKIVDDRKVDWVELANRDVDKVGLANILKLVAKGQAEISDFMTTDEGLDLSELDPMDPSSIKSAVSSQAENLRKLEATATSLGVSVEQLVDSMLQGTLADLIAQKTSSTSVEKEGE